MIARRNLNIQGATIQEFLLFEKSINMFNLRPSSFRLSHMTVLQPYFDQSQRSICCDWLKHCYKVLEPPQHQNTQLEQQELMHIFPTLDYNCSCSLCSQLLSEQLNRSHRVFQCFGNSIGNIIARFYNFVCLS